MLAPGPRVAVLQAVPAARSQRGAQLPLQRGVHSELQSGWMGSGSMGPLCLQR